MRTGARGGGGAACRPQACMCASAALRRKMGARSGAVRKGFADRTRRHIGLGNCERENRAAHRPRSAHASGIAGARTPPTMRARLQRLGSLRRAQVPSRGWRNGARMHASLIEERLVATKRCSARRDGVRRTAQGTLQKKPFETHMKLSGSRHGLPDVAQARGGTDRQHDQYPTRRDSQT